MRVNILYIQFGNWYVWVLRPRPHDYMLCGVWTSYGEWGAPHAR